MGSGKRTIAILYIATGPYIAFWKAFFLSFEEKFLPDFEKHYFVFTDIDAFFCIENERVHKIYQKAEPWPLPTLLKFHRFLELEAELLKYDYVYQSNANIVCKNIVYEQDFLPREAKGENLFFTQHPGFRQMKPCEFPYERNKKSKAYVPYNCGKDYVYGAMNGGKTKSYLEFIKKIDVDIIDDLKKGIIALWHDESHVNHEIVNLRNYRLLSAAFCYPVGFEIPEMCIISGVEKGTVFDVDKLKKSELQTVTQFANWKKRILQNDVIYKTGLTLKVFRDWALRKKLI